MTRIVAHPSPNSGPRRGGQRPDMVVLHYTGMATGAAALTRLCDPSAEVSAHYLVETDGRVFALVDEGLRAWHAGVSCWGAVTDVNSHSIGIELVNPGAELSYPPFAAPQMAALERLLAGILARHGIAPQCVVGHACVAPGRKADPGGKFDWRRLALQGLAVWLDPEPGQGGAADPARFRGAARRFGYGLAADGGWDAEALAVWRAFAMRFLPAAAAAPPFAGGVAHLERLAARWPCA